MKVGRVFPSEMSGWKNVCAVFLFYAATAIGSSAQTFTTLANFDPPNGSYPSGALIQGFDGNLYGTTTVNAVYFEGGTVFLMTPGGAITTLHNLSLSDGGVPTALVLNANGTFYGTACCGTTSNWGAAFNISARGEFTVLASFDSTTGSPDAAILATNGNYYGTTLNGGVSGSGSVFKMTPTGTLTTLYSFCTETNCPDQGTPDALVQGIDGNFYGTGTGGNSGRGTVFKISPSGALMTLYSFCTQPNLRRWIFSYRLSPSA